MLRVAIVTESLRMRRELADLLRERERFEVAASTATLDELRARNAEQLDDIDVVLMHVGIGSGVTLRGSDESFRLRAPEELSRIRALDEPLRALVLVTDDDELIASLRPFRGALALLPTAAADDQIISAIEAAASGLTVLHPEHHQSTHEPTLGDDPLTPREREVLHMLAAGLGNKEIAARLHMSDHTAKFHVSQIMAKLNAGSRTQAVSVAMRRGLVPL